MKIYLLLIIFFLMRGFTYANNSLEGTYCKTSNSTKIYLKVKSINDSLYYFQLKDYDTSNENAKQRSIVGTFIYAKNKGRLFNADCYPFHHFSLLKKADNILTIDTPYFRMYYTFNDIKGDYAKISDSVNVSFLEFKVILIPDNISIAKKQFKTDVYSFPSKYADVKKEEFNKGEKIFVITTVGGFIDNIPPPSEMVRFSLIVLPATKEREWINTDDLENEFK